MSQYAGIDLAFCHSRNPSGRTRHFRREVPDGGAVRTVRPCS